MASKVDATDTAVGNILTDDVRREGLGAITPTGGYFRIGHEFTPNLAIEGRVALPSAYEHLGRERPRGKQGELL